nr:MAG TPA: hypothetical protein [Bacteriophage sp.]
MGTNCCACSYLFVSVDNGRFVDKLLPKNLWGIFVLKSPHRGILSGKIPPLFYRVYPTCRYKARWDPFILILIYLLTGT